MRESAAASSPSEDPQNVTYAGSTHSVSTATMTGFPSVAALARTCVAIRSTSVALFLYAMTTTPSDCPSTTPSSGPPGVFWENQNGIVCHASREAACAAVRTAPRNRPYCSLTTLDDDFHPGSK